MLKTFFAFPGQSQACAVCIPDGAKLALYCGPQKINPVGRLNTVVFHAAIFSSRYS